MAEISKIQPIGSSTQYDLNALKIYTTNTAPTSSTQSFFVSFVNAQTNGYQDLRLHKTLTFWEDPESSKNCALVIGHGSDGYSGELDFMSSTKKQLSLKPAAITAGRTITLPDESGTIAIANSANSGYVRKTGDTMTGSLYWGSGGAGGYLNGSATDGGKNSILIGNDAWLGDCDNGGIIAVRGNTSNTQSGFFFFGGNGTDLGHLWYTGTGHSNVAFYGACWNDYAEMRNIPEANDSYDNSTERKIKLAGRCVREVGDGTMILSTSRLERGCKIISDTFGFNIGETDDCKTPIAVSGRVLAYIYEGREAAMQHIGWPVCSGPNGTVSIMTEEEEEKYPSRIVGTISEIPNYDTWGSGNVPVNNRIWIYVR